MHSCFRVRCIHHHAHCFHNSIRKTWHKIGLTECVIWMCTRIIHFPFLLLDAIISFCFQFLGVLNSKKAKLRELRDRLNKFESSGKLQQDDEEESTDKTESFDERSDDGKSEEEPDKDIPNSSKEVPPATSRPRGRKRK